MASSNDFGMPVTRSPSNPTPARPASRSPWMASDDARAAADELALGPAVLLPVIGETFQSLNDVRIRTMAYSSQHDWRASSASGVLGRAGAQKINMQCLRGGRLWKGKVGGDCQFRVRAAEKVRGGEVEVTFVHNQHTHDLHEVLSPSQALQKSGRTPRIMIDMDSDDDAGHGSDSSLSSLSSADNDDEIEDFGGNDDGEKSDGSTSGYSQTPYSDSGSDPSSDSDSDDEDEATVVGQKKSIPTKTIRVRKQNPLSALDKHDVIAQAHALIASGFVPSQLLGIRATNPTQLRINTVAFALVNGFKLNLDNYSRDVFSFRCHKSHTPKSGDRARCVFRIRAARSGEDWAVELVSGEHNHSLERKLTMETLGGGGNGRARSVTGRVGKQKRSREEEEIIVGSGASFSPRLVASKSLNAAGLMPSPPVKRHSHVANAVASGSGSKGTVATQYSGSSSQRRLPPSSTTPTTAPRLPAPLPAADRPWPVELARLIAIANTVLLDLSHVFAAIFIEAGVVNRYEFSKLLWTFSSENMKDERMLWFIERLQEERNGVVLNRLQIIQFRSGAKRLFSRIVAKTAKK